VDDAYFLYHSIGQYPGKAADIAQAMQEFGQIWGTANDAQWSYLLGKRVEFVDHWRAIISAAEGTVTTAENVTQAVHMLITALPPDRLTGKRILIGADCFPSNHFLLTELQRRLGFTFDTVPMRQGAAWVEDEDFVARWGPDVAVAVLTWVSSTTSHRIDLPAMVAHGRRMGSLIGVDITQAAGLLPFDVNEPAIDFAVTTSLKWMCGTPGAGVLYVAPDLISECSPELRGWFSQPDPFSWALDRFSFAPDIRRFDNGTPGCMSAACSLPALRWHAEQDSAAILAQNRRQTARIIQAVDDLGLRLITPRAESARGGSVMLRWPDAEPGAQVVDALREDGIFIDGRGQILRASPGVITTDDGVSALIAALARQTRG